MTKSRAAARVRKAAAGPGGQFGRVTVVKVDTWAHSDLDRVYRATGVNLQDCDPGERTAAIEWWSRKQAGESVAFADIYEHGSMSTWDTDDEDDDESEVDPTQTPTAP